MPLPRVGVLRARTVLCLGLLWVVAVLLSPPAGAQSAAKRSFDLPAQSAETAIKLFSDQSGKGVIMNADIVQGVRTSAVKGSFTPAEALAQLLAGTGLVAAHDTRSGTYVVHRASVPDAGAASPAGRSDALKKNETEESRSAVKPKPLLSRVAAVLALWLPPALSAAEGEGVISGRVQNQITGQYLNNARIVVRGTDRVVFTDESGMYRFPALPAGTVTLEAFYTGLDPQTATVELSPGRRIERDFELTSVARYGASGGTVKLDSFVVSTARETDGASIAINEQRFAPNIKNVVSTDSLGDVTDGNVGEFLKYVPGVTANFDTDEDAGSASTIAIRGFAANLTGVFTDGAQLANTSIGGGVSRSFSFSQVSMNNVSRIEVTKVPTPATAADSLAGSVNMISKSAFERKSGELRYRVALTADSEGGLSLRRTPHTNDRREHKVLPTVDLDYTQPFGPNFGIVLTAMSSDRYVHQDSAMFTYTTSGTGTGASISRPFLQSYRVVNTPRTIERRSLGLRADWRVTPNGVLSFSAQKSDYKSHKIGNLWLPSTGTQATPSPAPGIAMTFGPDFTSGATGRGAVSTSSAASLARPLGTNSGNLRYRFNDGSWKVDASVSQSLSKGGLRDLSEGHFRQLGVRTAPGTVRVVLRNPGGERPETIQVFNNANQEIDLFDLNNYQLTTAQSTPTYLRDEFRGGNLDVRKSLGFLRVPAAIQMGTAMRTQTRDVRRHSETWTYNPPDGNYSAARYAYTLYRNPEQFGFKNLPWVSIFKTYEDWQANPGLFTQTPAQRAAAETFLITNSQHFEETASALYAQGEIRLLNNRLLLLTGVRYERTEVDAAGMLHEPNAVWARSADGSFVRDARGQRVRRPEAGAAGSLEEVRLTRTERGYRARRSYDGYYPSVHLTFNAREDFLIRLAYARTYGRPDLQEIIPSSSIEDNDNSEIVSDPTAVRGRINIRNTGLRPWTADNYDLSLEYYTPQGGNFSAGVFHKKIRNFFGDFNQVATAADLEQLGLDAQYLGWQLTTRVNAGNAQVSGVEAGFRQSLRRLGGWGRHFDVFANGTWLELKGEREADFENFVPRSASGGVTFKRRPVTVMIKTSYRGRQNRGTEPAFGPDAHSYLFPRTITDVSIDYQFRRYSVFAHAQNVFNRPLAEYRFGSATPDYARRPYLLTGSGVKFTAGVRGSF